MEYNKLTIALGCSLSSAVFFSLKLYIQYFREKWMKFKLKKRILNLEILLSKAYHIFSVYVSLVIFTYRKLWAEKDGKFSSHFVGL